MAPEHRSAADDVASVSIVIVNWNAGAQLTTTLASLALHPPSEVWEAIVVDNASADGSAEAAGRVMPEARLIRNATNRGLAAANNQGLLAAGGRVVLLCNPDVEFSAGAVDALVDCLRRHQRAAFAVPRVVFPDGVLQTTAGDLPSLVEAIAGRQRQRRKRAAGTPSGFCWDGWPHDREVPVGRAGDVCYAVRREALVELGLQDERFPLDWEGIDWSARAAALGWEIWFCPDAVLVHDAGGSTSKAPRARWVVHTHRGMYRYFHNWRPRWWRPGLALVFAGRAVLKIVAIRLGAPLYERARRDRVR